MDIRHRLEALGACGDAKAWVQEQTGSGYDLWCKCDRGDWLIWLAARVGVDGRVIVRATCAVARTALVHVPPGDTRPLIAIETAEAWTRGEATCDEVLSAASAASRPPHAAYYAAYYAAKAAYYADTHAAFATHAAQAAAYAANAAAYAATRAADAAHTADAAYPLTQMQALDRAARAVRGLVPWGLVRDACNAK